MEVTRHSFLGRCSLQVTADSTCHVAFRRVRTLGVAGRNQESGAKKDFCRLASGASRRRLGIWEGSSFSSLFFTCSPLLLGQDVDMVSGTRDITLCITSSPIPLALRSGLLWDRRSDDGSGATGVGY